MVNLRRPQRKDPPAKRSRIPWRIAHLVLVGVLLAGCSRPAPAGEATNWMIGEDGGAEHGGCCISATLRDYGRIGLFALRGGVLPDGTAVLREGWMP